MLKRLLRFFFGAAILAFSSTSPASACGDCEYSTSVGICLPKGGCVINQINPIPQIGRGVTLLQSIASGNTTAMRTSLGDILINSPSCVGCSSLAHTLVPNMSDDQINQIVADGFLTYIATGDPVLVAIDVTTGIATQQSVKPPAGAPMPPAPPASRKQQVYSSHADCIVLFKAGQVYAGWKATPVLIGQDGLSHSPPNIDLYGGDIVNITAPLCKGWNIPSKQTALTTVSMIYEGQQPFNGTGAAIRWVDYGRQYTKPATARRQVRR